MKVFVAVATRHGATREIGDAIAEALAAAGHEAEVADPDDVESVEPYGAVVLGSSVYVGRWAASARALVDRLEHYLAARPVWLFSSGPVGNPPKPEGDPEEIPVLLARLNAREHRSFAGRLDTADLSLAERAVVALIQAEKGDYREWAEPMTWGAEISEELHRIEIAQVRRG